MSVDDMILLKWIQFWIWIQFSNENCFSDIENFTMTQVKYLNAPNGS